MRRRGSGDGSTGGSDGNSSGRRGRRLGRGRGRRRARGSDSGGDSDAASGGTLGARDGAYGAKRSRRSPGPVPVPVHWAAHESAPRGGGSIGSGRAAAGDGVGAADAGISGGGAGAGNGAAGGGGVHDTAREDTPNVCKIRIANAGAAPDVAPPKLLETWVYPLGAADFLDTIYRKRALVIHGGGMGRLLGMVEEHFQGLHLERMIEETASENVSCWMKPNDDGAIHSIDVESPAHALICHKAGASLYFRSSEQAEDVLVRAMSRDAQMNASAYYSSDGAVRGEIEVFASRKGHVTEWHFDFMENWTAQVRGTKTWQLKRGGVTHPLRGATPHYSSTDVIEQQTKVHRMQTSDFRFKPPAAYFEDCDTVTLRPGDLFYFPAGCWHRVVAQEDSISVNISLVGQTWADLASDMVRHLLWRHDDWRSIVRIKSGADGRDAVAGMLSDLQRMLGAVTPGHVLPDSALLPRTPVLRVDPVGTVVHPLRPPLQPKDILRVNPIAVILKGEEVPNEGGEWPVLELEDAGDQMSDAGTDRAVRGERPAGDGAPRSERPHGPHMVSPTPSDGAVAGGAGASATSHSHRAAGIRALPQAMGSRIVAAGSTAGGGDAGSLIAVASLRSDASVDESHADVTGGSVRLAESARSDLSVAGSQAELTAEGVSVASQISESEHEATEPVPSGHTAFIVHVNFGNESLASASRVVLHVPDAVAPFVEWLRLQMSTREIDPERMQFTAEAAANVIGGSVEALGPLIGALVYTGAVSREMAVVE